MSLSLNLIETFKLLINSFKYAIFDTLLISITILIILAIKNKDKKVLKYIITIINIVLIIIINYYYFKNILSFKFSNPINNIYFYFFNTCLYLILFSLMLLKFKIKNTYLIIYGISLVNILFSLFMTHYLNNIVIITISNIYPMIKFGNIIYFIFYVLLTKKVFDAIIKSSFKGVK